MKWVDSKHIFHRFDGSVYERAVRTWVPVGTLYHERTENCRGARVKSAG